MVNIIIFVMECYSLYTTLIYLTNKEKKMKNAQRILLAFVSLLTFSGAAQAVTFTVSDIVLNNVVGNTQDFKWSVAGKTSVDNFELAVGNSWTFTYATFATSDFTIDSNDAKAQTDTFFASFKVTPPTVGLTATDTGYVDAVQHIIPAVTQQVTTPAYCDAGQYSGTSNTVQSKCKEGHWHSATTKTVTITPALDLSYALVDFNKTVMQTFGNTGKYELTFNDLNDIKANGTYDLQATIALLSDITPDPILPVPVVPDPSTPGSTPVPEPRTLLLLGFGMIGLSIYGKRKINNS
jgi:hypothetical protein